MFRVKICGITNAQDANVAVEAGADAIGLNFYEDSPRFVTWSMAREIRHTVPAITGIEIVGVYVDRSPSEIANDRGWLGLDGIQLHGDEPPEVVARFVPEFQRPPDYETYERMQELKGSGATDEAKQLYREFTKVNPPLVIRARRWSGRGREAIVEDLVACEHAGSRPRVVLIDAALPGLYGGTGQQLPWHELAGYRTWLDDVFLVLAGGLTPDNVAEAIRIVRPAAVDVASGVESSPGKKDPAKVRDFVANALGAFDALK